jgi:hypothetical protein
MYLQHLNVYFFFGLMFVVGTVVFCLFSARAIGAAAERAPRAWPPR